MTTPNLPTSQWTVPSVPSYNMRALLVNPNDTITPPAGPGGSNQSIPLSTVIGMAVWPSGDPTGVKDAIAMNAAIAAMGTTSGTIIPMPGQWYWKPGGVSPVKLATGQTLVIDGHWGAVINAVGGASGDMLRMYNPSPQPGNYNGNAFSLRSGIRGLIIDGTNAAAGSTGLHLGDLMNLQTDVIIQHFNGANSVNLHLDNTVSWTEQADIRAGLIDGTTNVLFEISGTGAVSYGYGNYDFSIQASPGQDGVVFKAGSLLYSSHLKIRGNFGASTAFASNAVLRFTGVSPAGTSPAGAPSQSFSTVFDVDVECNAGPTGGTAGPYTLFIDKPSGCFANGTGQMNFTSTGGNFHAANATGAGDFQFFGPVLGDSTINFSVGSWPILFESPVGIGNFATAQTLVNGSTVNITGNLIPVTSAAAVTGIILPAGSVDGQMLSLYNTGTSSITFAIAGTSRVADGAGSPIAPATARLFMWSQAANLWYRTS